MNNMVVNIISEADTVEIGKLEYGTYVMGLYGHQKSVYQKVDKMKLNEGIGLDFPKNTSILFNIKTGSLRAVPGSTRVQVYNAELNLTRANNFLPHLKDRYKHTC